MYSHEVEYAIQLIETHGIEIANELDSFGRSWLMWEVTKGNIKVVKLLLQRGANKNARSRCGKKPIDFTSNEQMINLLSEW